MEFTLNFDKLSDGLLPVIIQDSATNKVLMLGFMNQEALDITLKTKKITFFSRTKQRIWTKGETSGNFLELVSLTADCDNDTLLAKVKPVGVVCHTGADTCFDEKNVEMPTEFINTLENIIKNYQQNPQENSYTSSLFKKGINKIAQKVGEEAVEIVIEAKDNNKDLFLGEAADLLYHYLVLLTAKNHTLAEVVDVLKQRHQKKV
jgi:phosphoribosyl-ATP pyrophosphohydrolase/phosphoribosyl-AMP cyclohydrolase